MRCRFISLTGRRGLVRPELCVRFKSPSQCQFIRTSFFGFLFFLNSLHEEMDEAKESDKRSSQNMTHGSGEGCFLAAKSFYFISSPGLVQMRQALVREAFVRFCLCTDALKNQNTNKEDSTGQPWAAQKFYRILTFTQTHRFRFRFLY